MLLRGHEVVRALYLLEVEDEWREELLMAPVYLTEQEKRIMGMKIQGMINGEVAMLLKLKLSSVERYLYLIKQKLREGGNTRVDNIPLVQQQNVCRKNKKRSKKSCKRVD